MRIPRPETGVEWLMVAVFVAIAVVLVAAAWREHSNPCVRSHVEHGRFLYMIHSGSVTIPIYGDETVCDQRRDP